MINLQKIRRIAVVGASANKEKYGYKVLKTLRERGYEVYPLNPKYEEIEGIKCYKSVEELPKNVELLVFVLPPEKGVKILKRAIELGFRNFWFQPGAESKEIFEVIERHKVNGVFACIMNLGKE